jgi:hypothetical protein
MNYIVIKVHKPDTDITLHLKTGDFLMWRDRPSLYNGWTWCQASIGKSGWIPKNWLEFDGDTCRLLKDYDSTELTVKPGDELQEILTESGWLYAVLQDGRRGWVPLDCVSAL